MCEEPTTKKISRRDFLKILGGSAGALTVVHPLEKIINPRDQDSNKEKQNFPEPTFETPTAMFYANYEAHAKFNVDSNTPIRYFEVDYKKEMRPRPHAILVEDALPSNLMQLQSPKQDLYDGGRILSDQGNPDSRRFFPDDQIRKMYDCNTSFVLEYVHFPSELHKLNEAIDLGLLVGESLLLTALALDRSIKGSKGKPAGNINNFGTIALTPLTCLSVSKVMAEATLLITHDPENKIDPSIKKFAERFQAISSFAHPDDALVFFRNITFARKLNLIAKDQSEKLKDKEKPRVSFRIGAGHTAVEDFTMMGNDMNIMFLDFYTNDFLQIIVDSNGGIEPLCKTRITPTRELIDGRDNSYIIEDTQLRQYLENRLKPKEK